MDGQTDKNDQKRLLNHPKEFLVHYVTSPRLKSAKNFQFEGGVTNLPMEKPTDGQTDPLIEMRGRV